MRCCDPDCGVHGEHPSALPGTVCNELLRMPQGMWALGKSLYAVCSDCETVVRVNKPFVGSVHLCVPEGQRGR